MFAIDTLILIGGVLLVLSIASSKFSARFGVPVLVLFLALGMLAGSEGIGGLEFENYPLAHAIGTLALVVILFDGGLSTPLQSVRLAWRPAGALATAGVLMTAAITGGAAAWLLGIRPLEGMLLGSIVGSTDAAAVFASLRHGGVRLRERLAAVLEIESGSNDPMAVFLTIGCIELLTGEVESVSALSMRFVSQMCFGAAAGLIVGRLAVWVTNRIHLDAAGLYPVLVSACGLLAYGLAAQFGGSGFLSVYLAGIVIGNSRLVFQRGIFLFHDAGAWLAQIVMFVVLGLLIFPSHLLNVAGSGLAIAAVLIFVARPIAVFITLLPFRIHWREQVFISWVGLKGAVPITLATFPLIHGVAGASLLFDVVFFVVVVSALVQGWSLPNVARWLALETPLEPEPPVTLEISSLREVEGDIVDFAVGEDSLAAGRRVRELALPEGVVIALIARRHQIIPPHGNTLIEPGDHVIVVLRPDARPLVNKVFARRAAKQDVLPPSLEFPLRGSITVGELEEFYDIRMDAPAEATLGEVVRQRLGKHAQEGQFVEFGQIALCIRGLNQDNTVARVGMVILPEMRQAEPSAQEPPRRRSTDA